jgi:hypothetical protein
MRLWLFLFVVAILPSAYHFNNWSCQISLPSSLVQLNEKSPSVFGRMSVWINVAKVTLKPLPGMKYIFGQ